MPGSVDERITESSGNVFRDMGLPDADLLLLKAQLVYEISKAIERRGWTEREAAGHLRVDQGWVSDLVHGRLSSFSADALVEFLMRLHARVSITIEDPAVRVASTFKCRSSNGPRVRSPTRAWSGRADHPISQGGGRIVPWGVDARHAAPRP